MTEPATPFWEGYVRSPEIEAQLIDAVARAIKAQPTMRLGQLMINLLGRDPSLMWNVYDEDTIRMLNKAAD